MGSDDGEVGVYYRHEDYAGFWRRLLVDVVDILVVLSIAIASFAVIAMTSVTGDEAPPSLLPLILVVVALAYFVVLKRSSFRTVGYRLGRVRIVNFQGERPTHWALTLRLLFAVFGPLNFLLDLIWIPSDKFRQALRDKFAHTYVIKATATAAGQGKLRYVSYHVLGTAFLFPEVKVPEERHAP